MQYTLLLYIEQLSLTSTSAIFLRLRSPQRGNWRQLNDKDFFQVGDITATTPRVRTWYDVKEQPDIFSSYCSNPLRTPQRTTQPFPRAHLLSYILSDNLGGAPRDEREKRRKRADYHKHQRKSKWPWYRIGWWKIYSIWADFDMQKNVK